MTGTPATPIEASRALLARGQLEDALAALAGSDAPQFRLARLVVLRAMGAYAPAMEEARAVLRVHPGHAQATTFLAMLHLLMGRADGWQMYRARWDTPGWPDAMPYPKAHLWDGQLKPGTSVLFWAEQGFGDTIQFARYLPWLHRQGLQLHLHCRRFPCGNRSRAAPVPSRPIYPCWICPACCPVSGRIFVISPICTFRWTQRWLRLRSAPLPG